MLITKALPWGPLLLAPPLHRDQRQDRLRHTDTSAVLPLVKATFRGPAAAQTSTGTAAVRPALLKTVLTGLGDFEGLFSMYRGNPFLLYLYSVT